MPANSSFPRRVKFIEDCLTVDTKIVVPAKAGIQVFLSIKLDSRFRGNDVVVVFNVPRLNKDQ